MNSRIFNSHRLYDAMKTRRSLHEVATPYKRYAVGNPQSKHPTPQFSSSE
jgi:hypothetical protein